MQPNNKQHLKKFSWLKIFNKLVPSHRSPRQEPRAGALGLVTGRPVRNPALALWGWSLVILLTLISLLSVRHLLTPGFHYGHDVIWHIQRIEVMFHQLKQGHFPVRWAPTLDNNYGIPLFNYLYPGPYYFASLFLFFGFSSITAYNLTMVFFYLLGGWGIYFLFRRQPFIGFVSALVYLFTPYQFVNLFVRGAFGEVAVMGLAPWVFVSLEDLQAKRRLRWYHPLPLALALISHNFLGPILFVLAFIYLLIIKSPVTGRPIKNPALALWGWSLVASLALASFFLIPMFFERSYLLSSLEKNFSFRYSDHFVYPKQFLYSKWDYWFSMPGIDKDGMTFQLGFANIAIISLAFFIFLFFRSQITDNRLLKFFILTFFFFIFLMLPQSDFVWRLFPLMQVIQFPWRLLAFTTLLSVLLGGFLLQKINHRHKILTFFLGCFLVSLAVINTRHYHRPMKTFTSQEFQSLYQLYAHKTTTSSRTELVPRWAPKQRYRPTDPTLFGDYLAKYSGGLRFLNANQQPGDLSFDVLAENDHSWIRVYQNYFPSWQATIDGQPTDLKPSSSGEILIRTKQGKHHYHLWVGQTDLERVADFISLLALVYIIYLALPLNKLKLNQNLLLILILCLATFFRFFHITQSPPSLNWDEVSLGYNAYSIIKTGRDEWGHFLPFIFKAFGEYKLPGMIYTLVPSISIFGLSDFALRFTSALIGVLSVYVLYLLGRRLVDSKFGLWSAFLLAISPWHIHLTRAVFEANLALLLLELSLLFFIKFLRHRNFSSLIFTTFFSVLAIYTYNSARILVPLLMGSYFILFYSYFSRLGYKLLILGFATFIFLLPNLHSLRDPNQLVRWRLVNFASQPGYIYQIEQARQHFQPQILAPLIHNRYTRYFYLFIRHYLAHFSPSFLFLTGGTHTQRSLPHHGLFYPLEFIFILWGFVLLFKSSLLLKKLILPLLVFSPVASAMTVNSPSTLRALNLILPLILIEALALKKFTVLFSRRLSLLLVFIFLGFTSHFFYREIFIYPYRYALDWQYGYRQAVNLIRQYPNDQVYFTTRRGEPYIFLLFYLPYDPHRYQQGPVQRVKDPTGWIHVLAFDRYHFVDFNKPEFNLTKLMQQPNVLIFALPDEVPSDLSPFQLIKDPSGQISFVVLQSNHD